MDCETCTEMLVDLACGELDDVRAAAVRKHCAGCTECGPALARLERGRSLSRALERVDPPAVSHVLRSAISRAALEYARVPASSPAVVPLDHSASAVGGAAIDGPAPAQSSSVVRLIPRWLERVGALAMRRQVAMAAVFLVTIGVGLAYYQTHPRMSEIADARRPDVVPAQEVAAGPSTAGSSGGANAARRIGVPVSPTPALAHAAQAARVEEPRPTQPFAQGGGSAHRAAAPPASDHAPFADDDVGAPYGNGQQAAVAPLARTGAEEQRALEANSAERPSVADGRTANPQREESPAVQRLRALLASATDPAERARLSNELAAELQRAGRMRETDQVAQAFAAAAPPLAVSPAASAAGASRAGQAAQPAGTVAGSVDADPASALGRGMYVAPRRARSAPARMARPMRPSPGNRADDSMELNAAY